jgi:hypothetical protein
MFILITYKVYLIHLILFHNLINSLYNLSSIYKLNRSLKKSNFLYLLNYYNTYFKISFIKIINRFNI